MTFAEAKIGSVVNHCGREFVIAEHVPGNRPDAALTICTTRTPIQGEHEHTFASFLSCEAVDPKTP